MNIPHFIRRLRLEMERRLIYEQMGGGIEDLGDMQVDMNTYVQGNIPEGSIGADGLDMRGRIAKRGDLDAVGVTMSAEKFKRMLASGIAKVTERYGLPQDLGAQFDQFAEEATMHIWRMPDMQKGVARITDIYDRAWKYFMDLVQMEGQIPDDHPFFKQRVYKQLPGIYYGGKLMKMSGSLTSARYSRALSGEMSRFANRPSAQKQFNNNVPTLYRGIVKKEVSSQFGMDLNDKNSAMQFESTDWEQIQSGDDRRGQPHIFIVQKQGGAMDDTGEWIEGQQPERGVVAVYGNPNNPGAAEVLYINFTEANAMIDQVQNSDIMDYFVRQQSGFYSANQIAQFNTLFNSLEGVDLNNGLSAHHYANPLIARLIKDGETLMTVSNALKKATITIGDLESWMPSAAANDQARGEKLEAFWNEVKGQVRSNPGEWRRVFATVFHEVKANPDPSGAEDWFDSLVSRMESL